MARKRARKASVRKTAGPKKATRKKATRKKAVPGKAAPKRATRKKARTRPPAPVEPDVREPRAVDDRLEFLDDDPAVVDRLGREAYVWSLAEHLRRWRFGTHAEPRQASHAYMLHVYGPWGAGKSTLVNLLRTELSRSSADGDGGEGGASSSDPADGAGRHPWVFVDFNAWEHAHLAAPWWRLLDRVYRAIVEDASGVTVVPCPCTPQGLAFGASAARVASWVRSLPLRASELCWRLRAGRSWGTLALIVAVAALGVALFVASLRGALPGDSSAVEAVSSLLGLGLTAWALGKGAVGSLVGGSGDAAQAFTLRAHDPMQKVREHFAQLVRSCGRPVAIAIDDLDRCAADYVVRLLEGVQTSFRDAPAVFIVCAERRWLAASFETQYEAYVAEHDAPGHRLGYRFVEKLFQLSAPVPHLSSEDQERFWRYLLTRQERSEAEVLEEDEGAQQLFEGAATSEAIMQRMEDARTDGRVAEPALRKAAIRRLTAREVEAELDHALAEHAHLLDRNPRAMKRLVNFYAVHSKALVAEGTVPVEAKLVAWPVLTMRWPVLGEFVVRQPEWLRATKARVDRRVRQLEGADDARADLERQMLRLLRTEPVQAVVERLEEEDIETYGGAGSRLG